MSEINVDLDSNKIKIIVKNLDSSYADIKFNVVNNTFVNLSFGYTLMQNQNRVQSNSFPKSEITYVFSDQKYLYSERIILKPTTSYKILFWFENNGTRFEETATITTPKSQKPFESWVWHYDLLSWQAPTKLPLDSSNYYWDEELIQWVKEEK